jgi:hypothetical protein
MTLMKRQGTGRVLHFTVTGALLGGMGLGGCTPKSVGPHTNTGYMGEPPPAEPLHVNEGPDEDPGAAEGGAEAPPVAPDHVNEGPVEEPPTELPPGAVIVNPVAQPDPEPETQDVNPGPQPEPKKAPKKK